MRASSSNRYDHIWTVFDRDMHPSFDEAVRLCRENDVSIGFSNPRFEVWLILHLEDHGSQDNSQEMKKYFNELSQD